MDIVESRVRKCLHEVKIIDKKMKDRSFKIEKYMVPLSDNKPFDRDEVVKVVLKGDFKIKDWSKWNF
ncbi:hypothetical protein [Methanobacterium sp. ACI-7]|uniref:hypothetical protein n=1 Tax=unclassified Methanobacterium TaxID=2627676 RepID=UPI0039C07B48